MGSGLTAIRGGVGAWIWHGPFSEGFSEGTFGRVFGRFPTDLDPMLGHFGFTSDHFWDNFGNIFSTIVIALIFIDFVPNLDLIDRPKKRF